MTRSTAVLRFALSTVAMVAAVSSNASAMPLPQDPEMQAESRADDRDLYTTEELDNLLAPVALYPDPILAQLFVAATYPEQIQLAQRYVETYGQSGLDEQPWDLSVRAIAHYEPVLNMLAERPNWATAVGRAYATQSGDVMASVQSLRHMAKAQGNLVSTDQQRVVVEREVIRIVPAQPRVVYVPVYDPYVVYYRPINYVSVATPYWSFGISYPIGAWLAYDCDWDTRVVFYHGWNDYGYRRSGWWVVSRPYVRYNPYYMGPRVAVVINTGIRYRHVNYGGFGYYNTVHHATAWDRSRMPGRGYARGGKSPAPDRYATPSRYAGAGRTAKPDNNVVPSVGGSRAGEGRGGVPSNGGRPGNGNGNGNNGRGNDRGNGRPSNDANRGNGGRSDIAAAPRANDPRLPVSEDRVKPTRVGGERRPLYPGGGEDISADRIRGGSVPRREASTGAAKSPSSNGTWNSTVGRAPRDEDRVRAPRSNGTSTSRSERADPRFETRSAPRVERSPEPRYEPRVERSTPRYESRPQRSEAPRMSAPRSEPRSAPRSEPRASAPRSSQPHASAPRSSGGGRGNSGGGSRGSKPDRG